MGGGMPQMPVNMPQGGLQSGEFVPNQVSNVPGSAESQKQWQRSIARAGQIKASTTKIIQTRKQLVDFLKQYNIQLLTSAVEFQQTRDFIASSYVVYLNYNNFKEPLVAFLERYPQMRESAEAVKNNLMSQGVSLNVVTKQSTINNPFEGMV